MAHDEPNQSGLSDDQARADQNAREKHWPTLLGTSNIGAEENLLEVAERESARFSVWLCECVLGTQSLDNPWTPAVVARWGEKVSRWQYMYGALAALFLRGTLSQLSDEQEFYALEDVALSEFRCRRLWTEEELRTAYIDDVLREFFQQGHGIPLFQRGPLPEQAVERVPEGDPEYTYVREAGRLQSLGNLRDIPSWAKRFFVRREHLRAYEWLFYTTDHPTDEEVEFRKHALAQWIEHNDEGRRESLEAEHAQLLAERRRLLDDRLGFLRDLAQREPELVHKLFCAAALKLPITAVDSRLTTLDENPLAFLVKDSAYYKDVAELCCLKLGMLPRQPMAGDLYPVRDFIIDHFSPSIGRFRWGAFAHINRVDGDVFHPHLEEFGYALGHVYEMISLGVPLVRETSEGLQDVIEPDALYVYLEQSRRYLTCPDTSHWPEWLQGHFFRRSHLAELKMWFEGGSYDLTNEQIAARRRAFRSAIGFPAEGNRRPALPASQKGTQLLGHVAAVRDRYYGPNFSFSDPDTWPKQTDIVAWLMSTYSLSKRLAEAVELVACPDEVRQRR
jgi:hypothetical protein